MTNGPRSSEDEWMEPVNAEAGEALTQAPLDPWMATLAREAHDVDASAIPRELMWARVRQQRAKRGRYASWGIRIAGIAALLVAGAGIGRFLLPVSGPSKYQTASSDSARRADSIAALGIGPEALAAMPRSNEPVRVAMDEHLARTVALLTVVRDDDPDLGPSTDISGWARELLSTTRLLIDEPQLDDERTRRLLQDLELVLAQIIQARASAPETKRAPNETMRETNLLPRMRAAVTASRFGDETTLGGGL